MRKRLFENSVYFNIVMASTCFLILLYGVIFRFFIIKPEKYVLKFEIPLLVKKEELDASAKAGVSDESYVVVFNENGVFFSDAKSIAEFNNNNVLFFPAVNGAVHLSEIKNGILKFLKDRKSLEKDSPLIFVSSEDVPMGVAISLLRGLQNMKIFGRFVLGTGIL
jgi:hypothetical protein